MEIEIVRAEGRLQLIDAGERVGSVWEAVHLPPGSARWQWTISAGPSTSPGMTGVGCGAEETEAEAIAAAADAWQKHRERIGPAG